MPLGIEAASADLVPTIYKAGLGSPSPALLR